MLVVLCVYSDSPPENLYENYQAGDSTYENVFPNKGKLQSECVVWHDKLSI